MTKEFIAGTPWDDLGCVVMTVGVGFEMIHLKEIASQKKVGTRKKKKKKEQMEGIVGKGGWYRQGK